MVKEKTSWENISSLEDLKVDWGYKPKNPLGRRAHARMRETELLSILDVRSIPVKLVAKGFEEKGFLLDVSSGGISVAIASRLEKERSLTVGFFLGRQKIVSKVKVKNVQEAGGKYKVGMMFEGLGKEYEEFITGIFASKISDY